jgi:ABC-type sugar transport system ATPase subunit
VTVFRDGAVVTTQNRSQVTEGDLIRYMVGREVSDIFGRRTLIDRQGPPRLSIERFSRAACFENIELRLWPGEIVGLAGLVGAGRTELGRAIFGAEPATAGRLLLDGAPIRIRTPQEAVRAGVAYVSEDRKTQGLFLRHAIRDNLVAPRLSAFASSGFVRDKRIHAYAAECRERFRIVAPHVNVPVQRLSGGNQQKVLMATWIGVRPRLLIADEPTRGVDVGARAEIYGYLRSLAAEGASVLLISSDLQEILGMSDRIVVMRAGKIAGRFEQHEATEERIVAAALGSGPAGQPS